MPTLVQLDEQIKALSEDNVKLCDDFDPKGTKPWAEIEKALDGNETKIKELQRQYRVYAENDAIQAGQIGKGGSDGPGLAEIAVKSLGRHVTDALGAKFAALDPGSERFELSAPEMGVKELAALVSAKAPTVPMTTTSLVGANDPSLVDYLRRVIEEPLRRPVVASLMAAGTVGNPSFSYHVQTPFNPAADGGFAYVAEGGTKPAMSFGFTAVTETLRKIAGIYKLTDEALDDLDYLASIINSQALARLGIFEENELLNGTGAGHIIGLLNRSGIQTETAADFTSGVGDNADAVFRAMTKVNTATFLPADGLVINPVDYQKIRLSRDANGQYYGGGFFLGPYGNGGSVDGQISVGGMPPLWGLRTVVTPVIAAGTALVGAFATAAQVFRKGGIRVDSTNSDQDDFVNNRVTFRIEERLGMACYIPAAFCKVTFDWVTGP